MNTQIKVMVACVLFVMSGAVSHAEFGVGVGASFNAKASFKSDPVFLPFTNDPGAAVSGIDHFYDDGYNRVDSSGNLGNETYYWGYQNTSQNDGNSITMNSTRGAINGADSSVSQDGAQPTIEFYWRKELVENDGWNIGIRTALRWQRIEAEASSVSSTITQTTSDSYSYTRIPPGAPFNGSYTGPNFLLGDTPVRNVTTGTDATVTSSRSLEANLVGLDIGPTITWEFAEKMRAVFSGGGTLAWINSEFSYADGSLVSGSSTENTLLFGLYAGADLQYQTAERWGLFVGANYSMLSNFDQQVDGQNAELQLNDLLNFRIGIYFQ